MPHAATTLGLLAVIVVTFALSSLSFAKEGQRGGGEEKEEVKKIKYEYFREGDAKPMIQTIRVNDVEAPQYIRKDFLSEEARTAVARPTQTPTPDACTAAAITQLAKVIVRGGLGVTYLIIVFKSELGPPTAFIVGLTILSIVGLI